MSIYKYVVNKLSDRMARGAVMKANKSMQESDRMVKMLKARRGTSSPQRERMRKAFEANQKAGKYSNGIGVGY